MLTEPTPSSDIVTATTLDNRNESGTADKIASRFKRENKVSEKIIIRFNIYTADYMEVHLLQTKLYR